MTDFVDKLADIYYDEMVDRLMITQALELLSQASAAADVYRHIEKRLTPEARLRCQFAACKMDMAIKDLMAAFDI